MDIPETFLTWIIEQNLAQIDSLSFNRYRKVWNFFWIIDRITDLAEFLIFFLQKLTIFIETRLINDPILCDNIVTTLWQHCDKVSECRWWLITFYYNCLEKWRGYQFWATTLNFDLLKEKLLKDFSVITNSCRSTKSDNQPVCCAVQCYFFFLFLLHLKNTAVAHSWLEPDLCVWLTQMVSNRKQWVYSSYAVHIIYICILQFYLCLLMFMCWTQVKFVFLACSSFLSWKSRVLWKMWI